MAFTSTERVTIKRLLGYSPDGTHIDPEISGASAEVETAVRALLARIAAVEAAMDSAALEGGRFKRVEDVHFNNTASALNDRLLQLIRQLAVYFDVPLGPGLEANASGSFSCGPIKLG